MARESGDIHRDFWWKQANQVRLRVNLAWWLETMSAPLVVLSVAGAALLLWTRRELPAVDSWMLWCAIAGAVVVLAMVCLAVAAKKFERPEQSLVRIEAAMLLRNGLSAASQGVTEWPAPLARIDAGLKWQWQRLVVPLVGSFALLAAGVWIPVAARRTAEHTPPDQPQAWKQLAAELENLSISEVVEETYLEETREKLDELRAQAEQEWFSHSSLEATDSLEKSHHAETARMARDLGTAERALGELQKNTGSGGEAEKNRLMEEFDQASKALRNGAMKPNAELLEQLRKMDLKNLPDLSPDQLRQLRENLEKHGQCLAECQGPGENPAAGNTAGNGGVNRGPGHDPNVLGAEKAALDTGEMAALEAKDLSRAAPGDLLELQDGEHEMNREASKLSVGGNTEATGKGGDRVWKESLDPDEQRALKRFFD